MPRWLNSLISTVFGVAGSLVVMKGAEKVMQLIQKYITNRKNKNKQKKDQEIIHGNQEIL